MLLKNRDFRAYFQCFKSNFIHFSAQNERVHWVFRCIVGVRVYFRCFKLSFIDFRAWNEGDIEFSISTCYLEHTTREVKSDQAAITKGKSLATVLERHQFSNALGDRQTTGDTPNSLTSPCRPKEAKQSCSGRGQTLGQGTQMLSLLPVLNGEFLSVSK